MGEEETEIHNKASASGKSKTIGLKVFDINEVGSKVYNYINQKI